MNCRSRMRRTVSMAAIAVFVLAPLVPGDAAHAADPDLGQRIDRLMTSNYPAGEPGAAVLAARDGEIVFRGAYGLANVELQVPVRPEHVFGLASVTKLFTALGAMMLVEDGKLRLEDRVIDYLPNLAKTEGVTIAHLLSHTSGMTGPIAKVPGYRLESLPREISPEDLIATYADFPLDFPPGERFEYSNEGVATLARIVELGSKQSWATFLQERIFRPAGMKSTYYPGHLGIVPMAVSGYEKDETGWKHAFQTSMTRGFGMGGLYSTVDDLFAWYKALVAGRLVKPETLAAMFTPFPLNAGGHSRHGYGFVVVDQQGHKVAGHGGSHFGMSTFIAMLPDDGIFVTVLTNRSAGEHSARDDVMAIIGLMLEERTAAR
jgi:CubicO group peptidase (beta-lactamase class C family)